MPPTVAPAQGTNPKYTTTIYDPAGRTISNSDPVGDTTSYLYDPNGNKTQSTDPAGVATTYCYYWQSAGCASSAPAGGGAAAMLYATTSPASMADPTGKTVTTTYWPGGDPHVTVTPGGSTTTTPDAAGDPTSVTYVKSGTYTQPTNVTFTYNTDQSRKTMIDATGTTTYSYNNNSGLTSKALAAKSGSGLSNQSVGYTYFTTGQVQTVVYPSYGTTTNPTVTYTYSPAGNIASVMDWLTNKTTFAQDADANPTITTLPNGTAATTAYNPADTPTSVTLASVANPTPPIAQLAYGRTPAEQIKSETDTQAITAANTYGYDPATRLNTINAATELYNPAGEPATTPSGASATYDQAGEITSDTTSTYTYSTNGDRILKTPSGAAIHYNVNQIDQLTSVATGTTTNGTYTYNGDGLRTGKTIGTTTATSTWDTTASTPTILSDGTNDYIHGPHGAVIEQLTQATNTPTYLTPDQIGSTRILTNQAGTTVGTYTYDPYGNQTAKTGTATTPIGYAGGYTDAETGLVYLVARYYDPTSDQFLSRDPLVPRTRSAYGYAGDNPLNATDPSGLATIGVCATVSVTVGPFAFFFDGCLTRTVRTTHDEIGIATTLGAGLGAGADLSVSAAYQVTNAPSLSALAGPFYFATVGGQYGFGGSLTVFWSEDRQTIGIEVGASLGAGVGVAGGLTDTGVLEFHGAEALVPRGVWDVLVPGMSLQHLLHTARKHIDAILREVC